MIECFMSSVSGWNLHDIIIHCWMLFIITFWMKLIQYNYHPLLDVTCHHFLDETCTVQLSSIVGCSLSSLSGWKLCKETIIPYWMILAIIFWMKLTIIIHYWMLSCLRILCFRLRYHLIAWAWASGMANSISESWRGVAEEAFWSKVGVSRIGQGWLCACN